MKTLINYINETRGVVTDKNNWDNLVKYIIDLINSSLEAWSKDTFNNIPVLKKEIKDNLPNWINKLNLITPQNPNNKQELSILGLLNSFGFVEQDNIKLNNKGQIENINIVFLKNNSDQLYYVFQHELQHAYDFCVSCGKIYNKKYHIAVPTWDEGDYFDILNGKYGNGEIADLFQNYSDFCHITELAAYSREYSKFLDNWLKTHNSFTLEDWNINRNKSGLMPLSIHVAFTALKDHLNLIDDETIDIILNALDEYDYCKKMCNKKFTGDDRGRFNKIIEWFTTKGREMTLKKYNRIREDMLMKYPNSTIVSPQDIIEGNI